MCWQVKAQYPGSTYLKFKFEWWNLGFDNSWPMGIKEYGEIQFSDFSNWLYTNDVPPALSWLYPNNVVPCLRDANWKELNSAP